MTLGYLSLWTFNRDPNAVVKSFTMQGYFCIWIFYLLSILKKSMLWKIPREGIFEFCLAQQMLFTPNYWILVHGPLVQSGKFSQININWNIVIHIVPLLLLLFQLYFEPTLKILFRWHYHIMYCFISVPINYCTYIINLRLYRLRQAHLSVFNLQNIF